MASLASLTTAGGVVGDNHTDALGVVHRLAKVDADTVYTWEKLPQAQFSEDGASWVQAGDKLLQYGTVLSTGENAQVVNLPRAFADANYSVVLRPIDSTVQGNGALGYEAGVVAQSTTTFTIDRDNDIDNADNTSFAWIAMGVAA